MCPKHKTEYCKMCKKCHECEMWTRWPPEDTLPPVPKK